MAELFATGHIVDAILGLVVLQGLVLLGLYKLNVRVIAPRAYLMNVLPGVCLMLALRASLVGAEWTVIAACLLAALVTHLAELWHRTVQGQADVKADAG